jgi:uncharacterized DUF497 family protein
MPISVAGFDWDDGNSDKCGKHGLTLAEIESVFHGTVMVLPDEDHSEAEQRFKAIGRTSAGRYVFIVYTLRRRGGQFLIRPISARYMHRKEVAHYEKQNEKENPEV